MVFATASPLVAITEAFSSSTLRISSTVRLISPSATALSTTTSLPRIPSAASSSSRLSFSAFLGAKLPARTPAGFGKARAVRARVVTAMAAAPKITEPVEVLVKAATGSPDKLGDCPFSQRVLITVEEKGLPYSYRLVDTANKPRWFLDVNPEGKVPVIKTADGWLADSDAITAALESDFPQPSLATPDDKKAVGAGVFGAFVKFLKSKDSADGTEQALLGELSALEDALKASGGPFVAGERVTAVDIGLSPKLYHMIVALPHYKNWHIPDTFTHVHAYIKALHSRESFKKTSAPPEVVIAGWNRALGITA
ncbi:unnamed protein product [Closterium sp. Naga37s-1]|nr:unnamed protein product [Closterium sp. Naga37s-1]